MTNIITTHKFWFLISILFFTSVAQSSYIQIVPVFNATVNEEAKTVAIDVELKNSGDESAFHVEVDIPQVNRSFPVSEEMTANGEGKTQFIFTFDELGISQKGRYGLISRIIYKDGNMFPFSAPYVIRIVLPPAPSYVLGGEFPDMKTAGILGLTGSASTTLVLKNTSSQDITVSKIEAIQPIEVSIQPQLKEVPFTLPHGGSKEIDLRLSKGNALEGSAYRVGVLVSGSQNDVAFASDFQFTAEIKPAALNTQTLMFGLLVAAAFVIIGVWFINKRKKS